MHLPRREEEGMVTDLVHEIALAADRILEGLRVQCSASLSLKKWKTKLRGKWWGCVSLDELMRGNNRSRAYPGDQWTVCDPAIKTFWIMI